MSELERIERLFKPRKIENKAIIRDIDEEEDGSPFF
jgi:hypothetical protein